MVPRRANKAEFSAMDIVCPAHKEKPRGAKLKARIFTSPINGSVDIKLCFGYTVLKFQTKDIN